MLRRLGYFAGKATESVRESPGISLLTSGTIAATLLVLGGYLTALQNLEGLALVWGRSATVAAYVADDWPVDRWNELRQSLQDLDAVARAELVTPVEALERFRSRGPQAAALVDGVSERILPASIELHLAGGFADLERVEELSARVKAIDGVSDVDYGREEFVRLQALLEVLRVGGLAVGLLIALATAFIVSNTIRLTVYGRREEVVIQRLVGATRWFVLTPYLLEGGFWGLVGGLAGAGLLFLADLTLAPEISLAVADVMGGLDIHLFTPEVGAGMVLAGILLGVVGSTLALRRFLEVETT